MEITRDRNLNDIEFSYTLSSNLIDQIGSWILPPISIAEGHYYFGAIISMLIIYYFYCFFNGKINNSIKKYFLIFFLVFFIFNFQIAAPKSSLIFDSLWSNFEIGWEMLQTCKIVTSRKRIACEEACLVGHQ